MHIRLQYALTPDDFMEFQRAYLKFRKSLSPARRFSGAALMLWLVIILLVLVIYCIMTLFSPAPAAPAPAAPAAPQSLRELALSLLPAVIAVALIYGFLLWLRRSKLLYRRYIDEMQKLRENHETEITDPGITIRQTGCVTTMEWTYFIRFVETRNTLLLFTSGRIGHILPKRAFASEEQLQQFRSFAQAHIGNQPIGFPVQLQQAAATGRFP